MAYQHGLITWADLNSPDVDASIAFYTGLFGWGAEDRFDPSGETRVYTMFTQDGKVVAGLGGRQPGSMEGVPALWTNYVNVDDIDAAAAAFVEQGGTALMPEPMQVMDTGWMFYGTDPTGAAIAMWKAGTHIGAEDFNKTGFMTWNEVLTRDVPAAIEFYSNVFGWEIGPMEGAPTPYWLIMSGDRLNGGLMEMPEGVHDDIPSHWMTYFVVDDVDASCAKAEELGGSLPTPPFDTGIGRFGVVLDPHGGVFSIMAPSEPGQPAPEQV